LDLGESKLPERELKVIRYWCNGDPHEYTDEVYGPQVPVHATLADHLECERLSVVHVSLIVSPAKVFLSRLTFVGSSRMTRLTMILASLSVMYPLGRNLVLVFDGAVGIIQNEATPMMRVNSPSSKNIHRHPAYPKTPRICKRPAPRKEVTMSVKGLMV